MGNLPSNLVNILGASNPSDAHPELSLLTIGRAGRGDVEFSSVLSGLITAVATNNVVLLKFVLITGISINTTDFDGNTLLHVAIINNSLRVFKFLMKRDDVDKNARNLQGATALTIAALSDNIYCVKKLIKKRANVNTTDIMGCTPLHYAIQFGSLELCEILVNAGSNINARNSAGKTPIYIACQYGKTGIIYMLLFYEADVSIPCKNGTIPLMVENFNSLDLELRLILYNYTFDDLGCTIELKTVVGAMAIKWPLFPLMLSKISNIIYDKYDLQDLNDSLVDFKFEHFKLFLGKFRFVVKDMLLYCCTLTSYLSAAESLKRVTSEVIDFLYSYIFVETDFIYDLVQSCCFSMSPTTSLVKLFHKNNLPLTDLTNLVCCLLSYGLKVTPSDLNAVYHFYGRCELFEIMLHMEIETSKDFIPCCTFYDHEVIQKSIMPYFMYDVNLNIETFLESPQSYLLMDLDVLLDYFALPKLKEFFLADGAASDKVIEKIESLPTVPKLVELARNATRDYIIQRLSIKNSSQFYTALKCLPVNEVYKKILSYEKKLYV